MTALTTSTSLRFSMLHTRPGLAFVLAAALLFCATVAGAQGVAEADLTLVKPEEVGMSSAGLEKLDEAMGQMVEDGELAGVLTMVARRGKLVHVEMAGKRDLASGAPVELDTIYRIHSMTKPIVGVALMTLYEEGKFELDEPVAKYIPEFADLKVAKEDGPDGVPIVEDADHPMTIRELMSHTGGLTYGLFSRTQVDLMYQKADVFDRDSTLADMIQKLSKIPLMYQPGTRWQYSISSDVQGYLIEVLTGKPLDQVLEERIFDPLGMADTGFWVEESKADRVATLYVSDREGNLEPQAADPNNPFYSDATSKPRFLNGGGGLLSTGPDYLRFALMLANEGELDGTRILKPETVKLMRTNQLPEGVDGISFFPGNQWGLDFAIINTPNPQMESPLAKGEFYWFGVGGAWFGVHPEHDLVVVGMIQLLGGQGAGKARMMSKKLAYEALLDVSAE